MTPFNKNNEKVKKQVAIDDNTLNIMMVLVATIVALLIMVTVYFIVVGVTASPDSPIGGGSKPVSGEGSYPFKDESLTVNLSYDIEGAKRISDIKSSNAILVDVSNGNIVAYKGLGEIHPASMTKVMTLIVVCENLKNADSLNDMVTVTAEHISNKTNDRKVSGYIGGPGYPAGEYSVKQLMYHLILNSDGVAALALADYIAGSEANFVKLMNEKAAELQLEKTNFVYCDGSNSIGHISTCRDMAKIMAYAMKNVKCAEILTSYSYVENGVAECYHGLLVSLLHNDTPASKVSIRTADIIAGKTGWTDSIDKGESGGCIVSYAKGKNGNNYIVVVAGAPGSSFTYEAAPNAVEDTVTILNNYVK